MLAFHMFCHETREKAAAIAREPLNIYLQSIVNAASDWISGVASKDYPNYDKIDRDPLAKKPSRRKSKRAAPGSARPRTSATRSPPTMAWSAALNPPHCR